MRFPMLLRTTLVVVALIAAACGDDGGVDQATVNSVVDDLTSDADDPPADSDDQPTDSDDQPAESDDPPAETEDPPAETDDPPVEEVDFAITSACQLLRHYSNDMWTEYPYFASLIVNTTTTGGGIIVTHNMVTEAFFTSGADGTGGFEVNWPVAMPGPVELPSSIKVDGVELIDTIVTDHLEGQGSFVAMASDFTDEWIVPDPCPFDVTIPPGNTLG